MMIRKVVEYTVREGELEPVLQAIREFVRAIAENEPATEYISYQRQGQRAFVHFMAFPDADAERGHQNAVYTQRFVEVLYPRCEVSPAFTDLEWIA